MRNNTTKKNEFEGLNLDEAIDSHIVKAGHNLILEVAPKGTANAMIVQSGVYEKRADGIFSLEVVFPETARNEKKSSLTDLIVAVFEHPDAPYWLLDAISDGINGNSNIHSFDPAYVRAAMAFTTPKKKEKR